MTQITATTAPTATATTTKPGTAIASDFTTFLKMLTTQMQNQDPLNPIDSTDYATQLATFSGVEQQVQTNNLLSALSSQFGLMGMAQLAGWVGQEARSTAPVWMDGGAVTVFPDIAATATRAVLVVRDANGDTVAREEMPPDSASFEWTGRDVTGATLPVGAYSLSVENWNGDTQINTTEVETYGRIIEARNTPDGISLILEGGISVPALQVTALRAG